MNITRANIRDIEELNDLFDAYRLFYGKKSDKKASSEFLSSRIKNKESEIFIARSEEGEAMGFVQLFPLFSSTRLKRFWLLNDLFVHPEYRGKGISKALIDRAKQLCRDTNACGMYLETGKENMIGNNLYPAAGFELMDDVNFYNWDVD